MVGRRVIEMLIERGARRVVCLDIAEVPKQDRHPSGKVEYQVGDIQDLPTVVAACKGVECVFHIAALVGPFFPHAMYMGVNYRGVQERNLLFCTIAKNAKTTGAMIGQGRKT